MYLMGQIGQNATDGATRVQARRQRSVRRSRGRAGALAALGALRQSVPEPVGDPTPAPPETMTVDRVEEFS